MSHYNMEKHAIPSVRNSRPSSQNSTHLPSTYHPPVHHKTAGIAPYQPVAYSDSDDDSHTLAKQRLTYTFNPPSPQAEPIYHNQSAYARSPQPSSPGPPPYAAVVPESRPGRYTVSSNAPEPQLYRSQRRAPSPFQDRHDLNTTVAAHSTAYSPSSPDAGVSSRLVYTSRSMPQGYVQSRPMNSSPATSPQPKINSPQNPQQSKINGPQNPQQPKINGPQNPRPYQLKPTLDSVSDERDKRHSGDSGTQVDALTDLLMKNMQVAGDPDFFGMCAKCGLSIMGESTGCTALDQLFHIQCFTCVSCDACLRGQPFFAMEGKPYCEACYLNTLEKCSVCSKPITDRVLRATGKPYHPACFTCVVCGKSLDGIPFTVDATSQIHCIEDFHRKFAPRCCVCLEPILPDRGQENLRIVALDRSFHMQCYKCEDCGILLSSQSEDGCGCYPFDEHILCQSCNANRINALTTKPITEL